MVKISVQANFVDRQQWTALAQKIETAGFDALYAADHLGSSVSPFTVLGAAAAVTNNVGLGTCVLNAGLRDPLSLASELATLDAVSNGRAIFGIGAGHTPAEWTMLARAYPSPGERVDRLTEMVHAVQQLLAGESVTVESRHVHLSQATLIEPRKIQESIPLSIGGNGRRVLQLAVELADIVGVTGLGRTMPDGQQHEVKWSARELDETFNLISQHANEVGRSPDIEALVQGVTITDDAPRAAEAIAKLITGASAEDLLSAPFMWMGTVQQIADQVLGAEQRWGINRYVIRDSAIEEVVAVMEILNQ